MGKKLTPSIKKLLSTSKSISKSTRRKIMKLAKKHDKGAAKNKKKPKTKMNKRGKKTKGREGLDFKTFHIDLNKPSTCMNQKKKRRCKSHRMPHAMSRGMACKNGMAHKNSMPRRRHGNSMIESILNSISQPMHHRHNRTPKKCNKSFVHFLNL